MHQEVDFACSKNTLLEVGVKLMLAQKCKNLMDVSSMNLNVRLSFHSLAMDEHIIQVAGRKLSYRSQQIRHTSVECGRGYFLGA